MGGGRTGLAADQEGEILPLIGKRSLVGNADFVDAGYRGRLQTHLLDIVALVVADLGRLDGPRGVQDKRLVDRSFGIGQADIEVVDQGRRGVVKAFDLKARRIRPYRQGLGHGASQLASFGQHGGTDREDL